MKRKEKAKFAKVNGNIKVPAIQSTVRVVISNECFYFGQKTANTFPKKKKKTSNTFLSLCFY